MRFALFALCLLPGPAAARTFTPPVADPTRSSPFAFAKSGHKAARAAAAAASGARGVGGC